MIENEKCYSKIILPDYKFDIDLKLYDGNYTIKNIVEETRKRSSNESILMLNFLDSNGVEIAGSVNASMLSRLSNFQISLNGGERIYNCVNIKYLANNTLINPIDKLDVKDFEEIERIIKKHNLSFASALDLAKRRNTPITYKDILNDYLENKYTAYIEYYRDLADKKEKRIGKFLNFFFYISLTQIVTLNLCTFVFFNWDIMEPITQCISYVNIIAGYYFWAITNTDYEMEAMVQWLKSKKMYRSLADPVLQEREEICRLLDESKI